MGHSFIQYSLKTFSGLLGYDSTQSELQAFYAGSNASNGGAVRLQECRKPLIRECRAEGNLRGFRVQDCGINGGGFLIENQAIGNIESGILYRFWFFRWLPKYYCNY